MPGCSVQGRRVETGHFLGMPISTIRRPRQGEEPVGLFHPPAQEATASRPLQSSATEGMDQAVEECAVGVLRLVGQSL